MEIIDDAYCVQGLKLVDVAERFGTPVYVYDADKITEQVEKLKQAFGGLKLKLKYATKALSNISILKLIKKNGCGLDVVSIQEAHLGIKAGFKPNEILFTPNSVSYQEIKQAVDLGLVINIDNISILEQFGHDYGSKVPCCIRLNPHIMAGGNTKISTGHIDSKFGISVYQERHIQRVVDTYGINVTGIHVHTGSDILDAEVFLRGAEIIFKVAKGFKNLKFLDFGSGFKVAYKEGDVTTDLTDVGKKLGDAFLSFCKEYGRELEIWFEPGKFIVSESGYFLVKANVIKTTPATVFVGVDSGMNHLLRPMMYDAYHDIVNLSNPNGVKRVYTVVGYICETDTFGWDRKLDEVKEGDILAIKNAGAYGFSMASNYNSRLRPAEVLIYKGEAHLIRKRETMEDLVRNQVEISLD
ncbi:diaminopimelate decarboxylase [Aureibacter tunicatorum]|uniref:Diaminopimelate decarboxylase n=1 Tax=Aureibacter tunicatorum TaxID=866807 RepID=A0AAE4BRQ7_9BACT|nr:diaminopimelate decarboxylase [Aureibacter tunicatorum]MDR6237477.1 diaminopimelate decarboxylase [Aureibacter tunicatorum]BDD06466.1 diaminopimelate decarboxylase [Aureibacter tunicatorum]